MANTSLQLETAVRQVKDYTSLISLLANELLWEVDSGLDQEEMTFEWTAEDLRLSQDAANRLNGGFIRQVRFTGAQPPWGVFFIEFNDKLYRTALRQILRGLVPKAKRDPSLKAWQQEQLLFICTTPDFQRFTFAHFRSDKSQSTRLAMFGWERDDRNIRTLCEFNLPALEWPDDEQDRQAWLSAWAKAFDKEPLTRDFFKRFDSAIDAVRRDLIKHQHLDPSEAYTRAQLLLLRMIFAYFLQNRGWLNQQRDYLPANFSEHRQKPKEFSYYHEFVENLFWSLSSPAGSGFGRLPGIPFLNGGLFDDDEFQPVPARKKQNPPLNVRNETFSYVFDEFLEKFNFTVREDTPLNQEVAVDPEMLGKVFESIVLHGEELDPDAFAPDKRKATGSYYTPRIVVHFICQESLRQYLIGRLPGERFAPNIAELMRIDASDGIDAGQIMRLKTLIRPEEAEKLLPHLLPRCCDPAVGSGAFPVGLLHELVNLTRMVQTAANGYVDPVKKKGSDWLHETKEKIIQECLYGVDVQQQAIEICQLRLWLSLVVDYHLGIDPFTASRDQFLAAINRISQLPNLEMNFRRGDSLHDHISGQPLIIQREATQRFRKDIDFIHEKGVKLHKAKKSEQKRKLRLEILERRLDLSRRALESELEDWLDERSKITDTLFADETASKSKRRQRIQEETERINRALKKIAEDERELDRLGRSGHDAAFYQRLRRLEGADFNSPVNFAWQIDFADIFAEKTVNSPSTLRGEFAFMNEVDQQPAFVEKRSERGGFDIVVGNPPFVTARNPIKRELYRKRWKRVCAGTYLLVSPFFELAFAILRPSGQLGFIVSNAFTKRDIGKPLIEKFFPTVDLQKLVDCAGLMFPGHGTPTCIVFGEAISPNSTSLIRVAAILPGGGDLKTPPEESPLWATLERHHDDPGYRDDRVVVADRTRSSLAKHPWILDSSALPILSAVEQSGGRLSSYGDSFGSMFDTHKDDVYIIGVDAIRRMGIETAATASLVMADQIRNWQVLGSQLVLKPYDDCWNLRQEDESGLFRYLRRFKAQLGGRATFGGKTYEAAGEPWYKYHQMSVEKITAPQSVIYPEIGTHAHFTVHSAGALLPQTAPLVLLGSRTLEAHLLLAALANSSAALFWLKQVCFSKRESEEGATDTYFEFAGGKVQQLPVPEQVAFALEGTSRSVANALTALSRQCWECGRKLSALALAKLFERSDEAYHDWNASLPGYVQPDGGIALPFSSAQEIRAALGSATEFRENLRREMIAHQEEMDWLAYESYGLLDTEQTEDLRSLAAHAFGETFDAEQELSLQREHRPFALWSQADCDIQQAIALIPADWSEPRKSLWKARLGVIAANEHIRRIEQPVYKRRWDEQWKVGSRWQCGQPAYDEEFIDAFTWWLSEKAEWWLENQSTGPASFYEWSSALWQDERIKAAWPVVAEAIARLENWKEQQKKKPATSERQPDPSYQALAKFFRTTVKDQTVPECIPFAIPYEQIPGATAQLKKIRGKLNVPRERFWITKDGLYRSFSFDELVEISGGGAGTGSSKTDHSGRRSGRNVSRPFE